MSGNQDMDKDAWNVLQSEHQETIEGLKEAAESGDYQVEKEAEQLTQDLLRVLEVKGDNIVQDIDQTEQRIEEAIESLKRALDSEGQKLQEFEHIEDVWDRIKKYIEYLYEQRLDPEYALTGNDMKYPQDIDLPRNISSNKYNVTVLEQDIQRFSKEQLGPIVKEVQTDQGSVRLEENKALKELASAANATVRDHQYLNKYKQILKIALEDEELRRMIAERNGLTELRYVNQSNEEALRTFEDTLRTIEEKEKGLINKLEEAHEILEKKTQVDDELLNEITNNFNIEDSSNGLLSGLISSESEDTGDPDTTAEMFALILQHYESIRDRKQESMQEHAEVLEEPGAFEKVSSSLVGILSSEEELEEKRREREEREREAREETQRLPDEIEELNNILAHLENSRETFEQNIIPAISAIEDKEKRDERIENSLVEEIEEYIERHQYLFDQSDPIERIESEAESEAEGEEAEFEDALENGIEDADLSSKNVEAYTNTPRDPSRMDEHGAFHQNLINLLQKDEEGQIDDILSKLEKALEAYKKTFREEDEEDEEVHDFESRIKSIESDIGELEGELNRLSERDLEQVRRGNHDLITGNSDRFSRYNVSLESVITEVQKLKSDIYKLEEFGSSEKSIIQIIEEMVEEAKREEEDIYGDMKDLVSAADAIKDQNSFADAIYISTQEYYSIEKPTENDVRRLEDEIDRIRQKVVEMHEKLEQLEEYSDKEIQIEDNEIEEMKRVVKELKKEGGELPKIINIIEPKGEENLTKYSDQEASRGLKLLRTNFEKLIEALNEQLEGEEKLTEEIGKIEEEVDEEIEIVEETLSGAEDFEEDIEELFYGTTLQVDRFEEKLDEVIERFENGELDRSEVLEWLRGVSDDRAGKLVVSITYSEDQLDSVNMKLAELDQEIHFTEEEPFSSWGLNPDKMMGYES